MKVKLLVLQSIVQFVIDVVKLHSFIFHRQEFTKGGLSPTGDEGKCLYWFKLQLNYLLYDSSVQTFF